MVFLLYESVNVKLMQIGSFALVLSEGKYSIDIDSLTCYCQYELCVNLVREDKRLFEPSSSPVCKCSTRLSREVNWSLHPSHWQTATLPENGPECSSSSLESG